MQKCPPVRIKKQKTKKNVKQKNGGCTGDVSPQTRAQDRFRGKFIPSARKMSLSLSSLPLVMCLRHLLFLHRLISPREGCTPWPRRFFTLDSCSQGPMRCTSQLHSAALVGSLPASRTRPTVMALTIRRAGWSAPIRRPYFSQQHPHPPPSGAWLSVLCVRPLHSAQ